jgi:hypothetical protein
LSDADLAQDCALPGGYLGGAYDTGWRRILDAFGASVAASDASLEAVTDEYMLEMRAKTKGYTFMRLVRGPSWERDDRDAIIWEHGRRNHLLRLQGVLAVVCPVLDDTPVCGIGIFDASEDETRRIIADDPGVRAGVFTFDLHPVRGFPGDRLP